MRERKAARSAWVAVVLLVTPLGLATLPARAGSQDQKKPTYAELVEKAKNGDPGLDFAALRLAFLDARGGHKRGPLIQES